MATTTTGHMDILPGFKLCRKGLHQYPEDKKACPVCHKNSQKAWYKAHREQIKENKRKWCEENAELIKEKARKRQKANQERVKRRLAAEKQATPPWANKTLIKHIYGQRNLLNTLTNDRYQVDHIYPLTSDYMCGLHVETNLQIITEKENRNKSNQWWPDQLDCQRQPVHVIFPKELTDLLDEKT